MADVSESSEDFGEDQAAIHSSEEAEASPEEQLKIYAKLVHKICGYYKWSFQEFRDTPWWLIKDLANILDERSDDLNLYIGYEEVSMFKNLRRWASANS